MIPDLFELRDHFCGIAESTKSQISRHVFDADLSKAASVSRIILLLRR
jgi:hypothetical protein